MPAKRRHIDPIERSIEQAMEPDRFISCRETSSFVRETERVAVEIEQLIPEQPDRAARLFGTFIGACHLKAEQFDDSGGDLGVLVGRLFQAWTRARQGAGADPAETARLLIYWMKNDPHGYCHHLDREVSKELDRDGLAAFAERIRAELESIAGVENEEQPHRDYNQRWWIGALKTVLAAAGEVEAFVAICERNGLGQEDCKVVADIHVRQALPQEALAWVERGLEMGVSPAGRSIADHDLRVLQRQLLAELGRNEEALISAWSDYEKHPSTYTYEELFRYVPAGKETGWHERAMDAAEDADLSAQIELYLKHRELERVASRVRHAMDDELAEESHYRSEPLAHQLEHSHPDLAARVYRALGMRIVNANKSKYYDEALAHLKRARACYLEAGLAHDWEGVVAEARQRHHRKKGFMAGFEEIVAGVERPPQPTFIELARQRWQEAGG
jgi:hypothetical protein